MFVMDPVASAQAPVPQIPQADAQATVQAPVSPQPQAMPPVPVLPSQPTAPVPGSPPQVQATPPTTQAAVVQDPQAQPDIQPQSSTPAVDAATLQGAAQSQPAQSVSVSKSKETGPLSSEVAGFVEVAGTDAFEAEPMPVEVASWMEKVQRGENGGAPTEVVVAQPNSPTADVSSSSRSVYVLPLGKATQKKALHQSVDTSIRWLAEWCRRMLHKLGSEAELQT